MQEYPEFSDSGKSSASITPLILGAVVGAGIALLLAPAHGKDTRRRVGHTAKRIGDGARQAFQKGRDGLNGVKQDAKSAIEKGRQEFMRSRSTQSPAL